MKKYLFAVVAALALACGATDETEQDIGQTDEAVTRSGYEAVASTNFGYGMTDNFAVPESCVRGTPAANQHCLLPEKKQRTWCVDGNSGGFSPAEFAAIQFGISEVSGASTSFTWQEVNHAVANCQADVRITIGTCSGTCASSGVIDACTCMSTHTLGQTLTESEQGTYTVLLGGVVFLDRNDVVANFGINNQNATDVMRHGFGHVFAGLEGLGGRGTGSANNALITGRAVSPLGTHTTLSAGEKCKAKAYSDSFTPGQFRYTTAISCGD